jgi:hypothetical protein
MRRENSNTASRTETAESDKKGPLAKAGRTQNLTRNAVRISKHEGNRIASTADSGEAQRLIPMGVPDEEFGTPGCNHTYRLRVSQMTEV